MKNRILSLNKILGGFICFLVLLGCEKDFLDRVPKDSLNEELVWTDPEGATQFVNAIYGEMPSGFDRWYDGWAKGLYLFDGASDDGDVSMGWTHSTILQNAEIQTTYVPWGNMWGNYYNLIRKANLALENLDRLEDEELRTRLKGEVYFLRGFMYHKLLRLFGYRSQGGEPTGVPLLDKSLSLGDDLQIPRATYNEVVDFIIADLDRAAEILPAKGGIDAGRATSGAAKAFKGRVLMYAERWQESAEASNEVIMGGKYSLFPEYNTLFLQENKNNQEIIFAKKFLYPDKHHQTNAGGTQNAGWDVYNSPPSYRGVSDGGWGGNLPTQNFVDAYDMTDGLPQDESPLYDPKNPWDNLDPRFEMTVVHNGAMFRGREVELFEGGRDIQFIHTGYFLRKFHNEDLVIYSQSSDQDWIFMRYAEVLLNYAEARNEASGPDGTVYAAINAIRSRVDMPDIPQGLSQDQMREEIRNERRIELAFEEHRFFDIRRWEIAPQLLNGPVYGMNVTSNGDGTFNYERIEVEERPFPERMYVLPIPQDEIDKNPEAKQILGW